MRCGDSIARSADGAKWVFHKFPPNGEPSSIAISSPGDLWLVQSGALMHSSDDGATWATEVMPEKLRISIVTSAGNAIYAVGRDTKGQSQIWIKVSQTVRTTVVHRGAINLAQQ